jgi:hypothetical protein
MINAFYAQNAMRFATLSADCLEITLPSEKHDGVFYNIQCKHTDHGIIAVQCQCRAFEYRKQCKHIDIVQQWHDEQAADSDVDNEFVVVAAGAMRGSDDLGMRGALTRNSGFSMFR